MDDQRLKGYRELTVEEITAMNQVKELGNTVGDMIAALKATESLDQSCIALAEYNLKQGFMWAVRGIAKPESF